jgi:UDP-N-acetylmuramoyl-tripeptide--D-alanyl-D-alanine ligase
MIPLPLGRIAEVTSGALTGMADPRAVVRGPVVIDSREAGPGSLFVAIKGERVDGHDFAIPACEAGAVAVLAARPVDVPAVIVGDVVASLASLAAAVAAELPATTVIGVTGSAGKTGTKDLIARIASRIGPTVAPVGSYNNEIGHPLTVLKADQDTRFLVLELSARGEGHIGYLARIAPPRIGVVLNVGTAHLGVFGGKDAIAKAKGELAEALPQGGVAVLNRDDPYVTAMAERTAARVMWFGRSAEADIRAEDEQVDERGRASFTLRTPSGAAPVRLRLYGRHAVLNVLAAAGVAYELGLPVATIADELSKAEPVSRWRMEVTDRPDGVTVVNDAYNANPDSMRAAFETFGVLARDRRRFAVIASLRELGDHGPELNEGVGALAASAGLECLIVVGENAGPILAGAGGVGVKNAPRAVIHVPDATAAAAELAARLAPGDAVLIKGPRAVGLERVAEHLLQKEPPPADPTAPPPAPLHPNPAPQPGAPTPQQAVFPSPQPGPGAPQGGPGRHQGMPGVGQGGPGLRQGEAGPAQGGLSAPYGGPGQHQGGPGVWEGGSGPRRGDSGPPQGLFGAAQGGFGGPQGGGARQGEPGVWQGGVGARPDGEPSREGGGSWWESPDSRQERPGPQGGGGGR